jgi:arylsulfatase A-like enzyme
VRRADDGCERAAYSIFVGFRSARVVSIRALLALVAAAGLCLSPTCAPKTAPRPNILFISIDTLRADHLGAYGYARPTSPHIDEFAKTAVVFEEAHSSASWTLPSLTSLMTSLYTSTHGCWKIDSRLDPSFHTLAEVLRNSGYDTAMVASHTFLSGRYGLQKGFTHVDSQILQTDPIKNITSPRISAKGIEWLREKAAVHDGIPWCLWLHYFDPHDDYLPHPGYSEQFGTTEEMDLYDGEIAFTDHYVGAVLDELSQLGLADDTIVVFVADHGEEFLEHGNMRHGSTLYEEVIHVPLMIRVPGNAARRVKPVVPTVDVMPTLLELAGAKASFAIEGTSLLPLMRGESAAEREAISEVRWHTDQDMKSLRKADWKYIDHRLGTARFDLLFALPKDPREETDVSVLFAPKTTELKTELQRRLKHARDLSASYGKSELSPNSAADAEHLVKLGYAGDEKPMETNSSHSPNDPLDDRTPGQKALDEAKANAARAPKK